MFITSNRAIINEIYNQNIHISSQIDFFQNFREDYCRFEFSLLENLEDIETLSECQLACEYINNCSYFVYDRPTKICKLNTMASNRPVCDIIHGTPEPDFNTCVNDGQLDWASNETNTQSGQSTSNGMKVKRFYFYKPPLKDFY